VNHKEPATWKIWQQPLTDPNWEAHDYAPSLRSFWAGEAARRQGEDAFRRFHLALLRARHQHSKSLAEPDTLLWAAQTAALELEKFQTSLGDPSCLDRLAHDHTRAVEMGIFGTPTLAFLDVEPAYLKLNWIPGPEESEAFWQEFRQIVVGRPFVVEIKRPH
jgi:predicted DsbA family dithiol-disulfide isomerase